ncbi:protein-glutamate O-methyltransferase CheR [Paenibacillus sp.]|uniref:CheR family methyltransferase n=1 Tax=Paenibacillus sp. TaxID=58172 RepID=UPI002D3A569B|nr:protein-glutamate O-methyltransferase CheR [Paenibacillus sp.]HZG55148.1 protein-glutamate O-methyltransferase CheR [Paenibacillus sp.]
MNAALNIEQFRRLRDYIYEKTGIYFNDSKLFFVERRIMQRMEALRVADLNEYYSMLWYESGGEELQAFIEVLTVNETYFFREFHQLKCFAEEVLPELVRRERGALTFWSAGCSTGEEAYTLAMILSEMLGAETLARCKIIATDIDNKVLACAKMGCYGERSTRHIPAPYVKRYFEPTGLELRVKDELRSLVEFRRLNLIDSAEMQAMREIDVIFCRNVLIYFDDQSRRQVTLDFYRSMKSGGYVFLGHSESMSPITSVFQLRKFQHSVFYQKQSER